MRQWSPRSSTCGRRQRGAAALLLVLGVMAVLLLLGAVAANSARQELRLSRGEATAEQTAILIESGLSWAAKQVDLGEMSNVPWPTAPFVPGDQPCRPQAPYPSYCVDALARRWFSGTADSIPIRVAYRLSASSPIGESFGWIVVDYLVGSKGKRGVWYVVANRAWCEPSPNTGTEVGTGPCVYGG